MQRLMIVTVITLYLSIFAVGQKGTEPAFTSYKVPVEKVTAKSINFKNDAGAKTFRTRLSEALKVGVNFAGHYIVAGWGCGTGCVSGAIIDARTGNVIWPIELYSLGVWYEGNSYVGEPVAYRKNSRLLIISGSPGVLDGQKEKPNGKYFYEWRGNALHQIKFIPFKSQQ